jgi:hypothetical protein
MVRVGETLAASVLGTAAAQPLGTGNALAAAISLQAACRNFRCQ